MRKWGVLVSIIDAVIVVGLLIPVAVLLAGPQDLREPGKGMAAAYQEWLVWVLVVMVLGGQALLLFLSVDTSQKRLEPRSHIFLSCLAGAVLTALLTFAVIGCIGFAVPGEKFGEARLRVLSSSLASPGFSGELSLTSSCATPRRLSTRLFPGCSGEAFWSC